jgi:hypothetical protein
MTTYFICNTDRYGQRTGTYRSIQLSDGDIETNCHGWKMYNGMFVYESEHQVMLACQD